MRPVEEVAAACPRSGVAEPLLGTELIGVAPLGNRRGVPGKAVLEAFLDGPRDRASSAAMMLLRSVVGPPGLEPPSA